MLLTGKTALITGGAGGIGNAISRAFAREGARVVLADLGTTAEGWGASDEPVFAAAEAMVAEGWRVEGRFIDVVDREAVDGLITETIREHGTIDVVVNAAGSLSFEPFIALSEETWRRTLDVHVTGTFNVSQAVARVWAAGMSGGSLINVGSDAGFFGHPDAVAYATAKAAITGMTLSCAQAFAAFGGRANVLIPQALTRMTEQIPIDERPDSERWAAGEFDPENVTPMAVVLASDGGRWITGQIIGSFGYEVHKYSTPGRVKSLFNDGPWLPTQLSSRVEDFFDR